MPTTKSYGTVQFMREKEEGRARSLKSDKNRQTLTRGIEVGSGHLEKRCRDKTGTERLAPVGERERLAKSGWPY